MGKQRVDEAVLSRVLLHKRRTKEQIEKSLQNYVGLGFDFEVLELGEESKVDGQDFCFIHYFTEYDDETKKSGVDYYIYIWYLNTNVAGEFYITEIDVEEEEF